MSILITAVTGFKNRGVEALVRSTVEGIRSQKYLGPIKILTLTPEYDRWRMNAEGLSYHQDAFTDRRMTTLKKLGSLAEPLTKRVAGPWVANRDLVRKSSLVIASGGDMFGSDYGEFSAYLEPLKLAQKHGIPTVFLGQSVGPFKEKERATEWGQCAKNAKLVTVRESFTYNYVTQTLGVPSENVVLVTDTAFLLQVPEQSHSEKLLKFHGIQRDKGVVACGISEGITNFSKLDRSQHVNAWANTIRHILDVWGAQVLLIPHVQEGYPWNNDCFKARSILEALDYDPRIKVAAGEYSASEFKGMISLCDMVVSERMHASIAGLSSGVCSVSVGYSVKARGITSDLYGEKDTNDFLLIPVADFLDSTSSLQRLTSSWNERTRLRDVLQARLPWAKLQATKNFEALAKLFP